MLTISKVAVSYALVQSLGTVTVGVASGMLKGYSFFDALKGSVFDGLDSFANGFMIGAFIGGVGVCSGLIKPTACFVAGTMISVPTSIGIGYVPIEEIKVGDIVYSYDFDAGKCTENTVSETFEKKVDTIVNLTIENETITTTEDHPFFCMETNDWIPASKLHIGNHICRIDGSFSVINAKDIIDLNSCVSVYNFTVNKSHTYFVGFNSVLVHNECNNLDYNRQKGVKKAWEQEQEAVKAHSSKYKWTWKEKWQLKKTGKVEGYDGCHIIDVHVNPNLADNPNNIIFLKRYEFRPGEVTHFMVHNNDPEIMYNSFCILKTTPLWRGFRYTIKICETFVSHIFIFYLVYTYLLLYNK